MKIQHLAVAWAIKACALVVVAMGVLLSMGDAQTATLYDASSDWAYTKKIITGLAQRCYSFTCVATHTSMMLWTKTQMNAWVAFYATSNCTGEKTIKKYGGEGALSAADYGMDKQVALFMILESGVYPTRGYIDACPPQTEPRVIESGMLTPRGEYSSSSNGSADMSVLGDHSSQDFDTAGVVAALDTNSARSTREAWR